MVTAEEKHQIICDSCKHKFASPNKPIGFNALIEASSKVYMDRMKKYVDEALEEGIRFFVTSLGNPKWVVEKAHAVGGLVFHDVIDRRWALKAKEAGVDGLICVNNLAGGHSGAQSPEELIRTLKDLNLPLVCAGGVGSRKEFEAMLNLGYQAVQLGTRLIATQECKASDDYKNAIVKATAKDIVHTEKITGVDVAVINTPMVQKIGLKSGPIAKFMLKHPKAKHWMRTIYALKSFSHLKRSMKKPSPYRDYWQAGKSVQTIDSIKSVKEVISEFVI
jgi:nitronate monooxygenase